MILLETFTKERFQSIYETFALKLKESCTAAYPAEYAQGFKGASDGSDDCIAALKQVTLMQLDDIKIFLEEAEALLIMECRGEKQKAYALLLDRLIPLTSKLRPNDYNNRLYNLRLFVSFLALNKVVRLNNLVGSHPKSTSGATRISSTSLRCFLPPLASDFWIGSTKNRYNELEQHIQTPVFTKHYLDYIEREKLSIDKLNQAFRRLADIIVANGITNPNEITFDVLMAYNDDLIEYYGGRPAAYNIKPALSLLMCAQPDKDTSFYDEFIRKRIKIERGRPTNNTNEVAYLSSSKKAQSLIGVGVDRVDKVIVPSRDRKNVLDYGYWSDTGGSDTQFNPDNLFQENLWIAAQQDYVRSTSIETGTIKQKNQRLSFLNKYLFSYLPAYFKSGLSGDFTYPEHPEQFLHSLFVQRSNVFEIENMDKFTVGFQYPVTLQQFVYDMTSSAQFENTTNNNSGRDALSIISGFFDHLCTCDSKTINGFRNPLNGKIKEKVGRRYIKNRKYVFALDYWLGLRSFCSAITDQILDENLRCLTEGEKSKKYIFVNKNINIDGSHSMFIGKINLELFAQIKLRKDESIRGAKGVKDQNIYIHNHISWSLITLLLHSGLRRSNALWLDDQECFSLISNTKQNFQRLLVTTDKAKSTSFPVVIASSTMDMLKKVYKVKKFVVKSNPEIGEATPYNGNKDSKWGNVSPLFRIKPTHNDAAYPNHFSEIINEYEAFLRRNGVDLEPTTLYAPQLHYGLDEFIHLSQIGEVNTKPCEVSVNYLDNYPAVKFTPITKKTRITPHSLRTMTVSIFAPIVGADIVGNLLTGQTEATVSYYTKELPDCSSKELVNQVVALLETDLDTFNHLITVRDSEINQESFESDLKVSPNSTINKYNAQSINFEIMGDDSSHANGLKALSKVNTSNIAYFRTHICPLGGNCPQEIANSMEGKKKCFLCPLAVVTNNHLPAISATIRFLCDDIKTTNTQLDTFKMLETERVELRDKKMELVAEASYWEARRSVIEESNENGIYYVSDEGLQLMNSIKPQNASEQEKLFLRLKETEGVPMLHSEKLKMQASRLRRKIEVQAKIRSSENTEDLSDIEYLAIVLNMKIDLYGLTQSDKMALMNLKI